MKNSVSSQFEFYFGLISTLVVAFIIPLIVTITECSHLLFLFYIYIIPGAAMILHAFLREEKTFIEAAQQKSEEGEEE